MMEMLKLLRLPRLIFKNSSKSVSYYITTPIFYVNSAPHIGHLHTVLLADALNVYQRLKLGTDETVFSTGTDEHGIKIQAAAHANGMSYREFCDINSEKFKALFKSYDTTITDFVRTSEERHSNAVRSIWQELNNRGFIYKCNYSGWYNVTDELFVSESLVTQKEIDGVTHHVDQNDNKLVWSSEENYMFKMDLVREEVLKWLLDSNPITPDKFREEVVKMIKDTRDISISRPRDRLEWGISVPNDPSQTVYVWLDALTNYLTVVGYPRPQDELLRWPVDCQVLGKDIIRFHAIYWPAFLVALSLPLPKKLVCHSHWLVDSLKMSKSRGNVVDPWEETRQLTTEGLRYYLIRCSTTHSDNEYSRTQALRRINSELADTYGNLLNRCCAPAINPRQVITKTFLTNALTPEIIHLVDQLRALASLCESHYEQADFYKGVDLIMSTLRYNNKLYEDYKPWKLVKEIDSNEESLRIYHNLQAITFETLRICSILLQPVIPKLSEQALSWLRCSNTRWQDAQVCPSLYESNQTETKLLKDTKSILFRRLNSV